MTTRRRLPQFRDSVSYLVAACWARSQTALMKGGGLVTSPRIAKHSGGVDAAAIRETDHRQRP
jgi:hypothetical protein